MATPRSSKRCCSTVTGGKTVRTWSFQAHSCTRVGSVGGGGCPTAQLRGNNQGIVKLVGNALARSPKVVPIREVRRSATAALLDGGQNNGMVVASRALETAIQLARDSGVAAVGMRNTCTSTGAIGYYVDRAARQGFVGASYGCARRGDGTARRG